MARIFISHSHLDEAIASKFVQFLLLALNIQEKEIFCSSNPNQGLSYSSSSLQDQLKEKLKNTEALIVLITADSLHSAWLPFEAGAFWTTDKPIIPILGPGLTLNNLQGPFRNSVSISIDANDWKYQVDQAINQLNNELKIDQRSTSKIRDKTLQEFYNYLRAWKSKRPASDKSQQVSLPKCRELVYRINEQYERMKIWKELHKEWQSLSCSLMSQRSLFTQIENLELQYNHLGIWCKPNYYLVEKIEELLDRIDQTNQNKEITLKIATYYEGRNDHPSKLRVFTKDIKNDLKTFDNNTWSKIKLNLSELDKQLKLSKELLVFKGKQDVTDIKNHIKEQEEEKKQKEKSKLKKLEGIIKKTLINTQTIENIITQFLKFLDDELQDSIKKFDEILDQLQKNVN